VCVFWCARQELNLRPAGSKADEVGFCNALILRLVTALISVWRGFAAFHLYNSLFLLCPVVSDIKIGTLLAASRARGVRLGRIYIFRPSNDQSVLEGDMIERRGLFTAQLL